MTRRTSAARRAAIAACAAAGFLALTSAPAPAHGVRCGDTVKRDTTLRGSLTNCPGDGLVIGADDITLDLNGYTIDGDKTGAPDCDLTATGVSNPAGHDGVTIENGTVREFGEGIGGGFGRSLLRNLTVRDNRGHAIGIGAFAPDNVDDNRITSNHIAHNGCGGINVTGTNNIRIADNRLDDDGIDLIGVNYSVVEHNSSSGNFDGAGIFGFDAKHNRIERNAVSNSQDGIFLYFSSDNRVSENSSWANYFGGIGLKASSRNWISDNSTWANPAGIGLEADVGLEDRSNANTVRGNRSVRDGIGVLVLASDANQIVGNRAVEALEHPPGFPLPGGFGIAVDGGSDNVMAANTIEGAEKDGIRLLATSDWGGVAAGNVLRGNVVRDAGGDGVLVDASAAGSLLEGNLALWSAGDGFDIAGPATLTRNRALRNANLGIKAGPGVTDGGGNRARGNGDPAQCTGNIVCG